MLVRENWNIFTLQRNLSFLPSANEERSKKCLKDLFWACKSHGLFPSNFMLWLVVFEVSDRYDTFFWLEKLYDISETSSPHASCSSASLNHPISIVYFSGWENSSFFSNKKPKEKKFNLKLFRFFNRFYLQFFRSHVHVQLKFPFCLGKFNHLIKRRPLRNTKFQRSNVYLKEKPKNETRNSRILFTFMNIYSQRIIPWTIV